MTRTERVKHTVLNILGKPFGVVNLPKEDIVSIEGGEHMSDEKEMWLFTKIERWPTSREVTVVNGKGRQQIFREIVDDDHTKESLIVRVR